MSVGVNEVHRIGALQGRLFSTFGIFKVMAVNELDTGKTLVNHFGEGLDPNLIRALSGRKDLYLLCATGDNVPILSCVPHIDAGYVSVVVDFREWDVGDEIKSIIGKLS